MKRLIYFIFIFLYTFFACQDDSENLPPKKKDTYSWPVEPVSITLPEATLAELDKIASGIPSKVIQDRMIELVDATPEDATIYIAIYSFNNFPYFMNALERADSRNVKMNIMIDMPSHNQKIIDTNEPYVNELKTWGDNVKVVLMNNDAGAIAIMHNKFILLSKVITEEGEVGNVVFQSSMNFSEGGGNKINDAVTLSHDGLYQAYLDYWQDMRTLSGGGMKENYEYREFYDPEAGITAFFYPRRSDGEILSDNIIDLLDNITDPSSTSIKIGMSGWSDSRVDIAYKLGELYDQGANVEIITKSSVASSVQDKLKELAEKGAYVNIYDMSKGSNIHSKFMIIEGEWKGEETNLVLTGSQNFTNNAYKYNNEISLLFQDHEFFDIYKNYFEEIKILPGICCP